MKLSHTKTALVLLLLLAETSGFGQMIKGTSSSSSSYSSSEGTTALKEHYFSASLSYHPVSWDLYSYGWTGDLQMNGVGLSLTHFDAFIKNVPLYVEYGLSIRYLFARGQGHGSLGPEYKFTNAFNFLTLNIPANIHYCIQTPVAGLSVQPFTGFEVYIIALSNEFEQGVGRKMVDGVLQPDAPYTESRDFLKYISESDVHEDV